MPRGTRALVHIAPMCHHRSNQKEADERMGQNAMLQQGLQNSRHGQLDMHLTRSLATAHLCATVTPNAMTKAEALYQQSEHDQGPFRKEHSPAHRFGGVH